MISVEQAENLIFQSQLLFKTEQIPLTQAAGRRIKEDICADRDFPPFNRVTMDGIAINFEGWIKGVKSYDIKGVQAAGDSPMLIEEAHHCLEVMTGAVLPEGADTVIPYEHFSKNKNQAEIAVDPTKGQNIHRQGTDRVASQVIVPTGTLLGSPEIGVAATVGKSFVQVTSLPTVAIISTGDELVGIDETPLPHQIRSSNTHTMADALHRWHIVPDAFHLIDNLEGITQKLAGLLAKYQILILSGGVSKGKFDHVPTALEQLQVTKHFHKIQQRPGKPFWFGAHPAGCLVFAFPGNPVSSFMCFNRYFKPWMDQQMGFRPHKLSALLQQDVLFNPDLTYFAQVRIEHQQQQLCAWPVEGHGSGDLANLVDADGFIELPRGRNHFKTGEVFPLYTYRDL